MNEFYHILVDEINFTAPPLVGRSACLTEKADADMQKKTKWRENEAGSLYREGV